MASITDEMAKEGAALIAIARALEGKTPEEICRILAMAATAMGHYYEAANFNKLAEQHHVRAERETAMAARDAKKREDSNG